MGMKEAQQELQIKNALVLSVKEVHMLREMTIPARKAASGY